MRGARADIVCLLSASLRPGRMETVAAAPAPAQHSLNAIPAIGIVRLDESPDDTVPVGERWP